MRNFVLVGLAACVSAFHVAPSALVHQRCSQYPVRDFVYGTSLKVLLEVHKSRDQHCSPVSYGFSTSLQSRAVQQITTLRTRWRTASCHGNTLALRMAEDSKKGGAASSVTPVADKHVTVYFVWRRCRRYRCVHDDNVFCRLNMIRSHNRDGFTIGLDVCHRRRLRIYSR